MSFADKYIKEKEKRISKLMGRILDLIEEEDISLEEMSDVFTNLQVNYNRMLLDDIKKLKEKDG